MKSLLVCLVLCGLFIQNINTTHDALPENQNQPQLSRGERAISGKCAVDAAKTLSKTSCCGNLTDWQTYYIYKLSAYELNGQCCRDVLTYTGAASFAITTNNLRTNIPGSCFCDSSASDCHDADRDPCLKSRERLSSYYGEGCGNVTFDGYRRPFSYNASLEESSGRCCRLNAMSDGETVSWNPLRIPGQCYCKPKTTTSSSTTTSAPTTTHAPTTTPEPVPRTAGPEASTVFRSGSAGGTSAGPTPGTVCSCGCTCTSVIPECSATNTITTTASATTYIPGESMTRPTRLCPAYGGPLGRENGGAACNVTGLLVFVSPENPEMGTLCHGVYVYNPRDTTSNQAAIYVTEEISEAFSVLTEASTSVTGSSDSVNFDWETQVTAVTPENVVVAGVKSHLVHGDLLKTACSGPACVYDSSTMSGYLDISSCAFYTYSDGSTDGTTHSWVLTRSPVVKAEGCRTNRATDECWAFKDTSLTLCLMETGAPVYCPLSTGEMVVYGLVAFDSTCGSDSVFSVSPL